MRIAVVHHDRCHPLKCGTECILYCPRVRTGDETIVIGDDRRIVISEELCVGCGICVKKCPFEALDIINLPEELDQPTHRYGQNGFVLYGLPIPVEGKVTGILGPNGIGKSTAVKILSGMIVPNLGVTDTGVSWEDVLDLFQGTELFDYIQMLSQKKVRVAVKPQYIDQIPKVFTGSVRELLATTDERGKLDHYIDRLSLRPILDRTIKNLSGGELQRVAIAICLSRDADLYILDEPSAHLDVEQRVKISRLIRRHAEGRDASTLVIDHDIYVIDMISDRILVFEGEPGINGKAMGPFDMAPGMNRFLAALGITFRRDKTGRPRINKPGSFLDREQMAAGEYYYAEISKS